MTKKIFEELPARKHAPAKAAPAAAAKGEGSVEGGDSEKKIRQAVYDIRYRARREGIDLRAAYSQYMSNSNLTAPEQAAVRAKLFGKDGGGAKKEVKEGFPNVKPSNRAGDAGTAGLKLIDTGSGTGYINRHSKGKVLSPGTVDKIMSGDLMVKGGQKSPKKQMQVAHYDATMSDGASSAVAKAMFKVFAEVKEEVIQEDETSEKKYKVRVIDEKSGRSYVRYADREKITALRAKGLKVEMTEHGDPYEGTKREGKGKMDPVAKKPSDRDGDVNNDGKKDGTDKYIYNRRDAINAAIAKKKAMKEEFLVDGTTSTEGQNKGKITGEKVDNYKSGAVKVMKSVEESKSKKLFLDMIAEKKKADACAHNGKDEECGVHGMKACPDTVEEEVKNCGCGKNPCITYGESKEDKKECTPGERETYRTLLKNKMRAMGIKRPLIMDMEPGEEKTMKAMTSSDAKLAATCEETEQVDENVAAVAKKALDKGAEFMDTNPVGKAIKNVLKPVRPARPAEPATERIRDERNKLNRRRGNVTAGGGTPDTQKADKESERLGKNRMRQAGY